METWMIILSSPALTRWWGLGIFSLELAPARPASSPPSWERHRIGQEPVILAEGLSVFGSYRATVRQGIPRTYETGVTV